MKKIILIPICFLIFNCGLTFNSEVASTNRQNLNKISLGDTKEVVIEKMGGIKIITTYESQINFPYKTEILVDKNKTYEVLFYFSNIIKDDSKITDDELTPIVFFEGKVIGYGWMFVEDNIEKYQLDIRN